MHFSAQQMQASVFVHEFVKDCRKAGLAVDEEWTPPADTTQLQAILATHTATIQMIVNGMKRVDAKNGLKPLIWHAFKDALAFLNFVS